MDFIISDTHFNHVRILVYEPIRLQWGKTIEEMTETFIRAWQGVVKPEDTVFHVGDFAMSLPALWPGLRARLPGRITHIKGNHDRAGFPALPGDISVSKHSMTHPQFGKILMKHNPDHFTEEEAAEYDHLVHGHIHTSGYRNTMAPAIRAKVLCACVETLPTAPAPCPFDRLLELRRPLG